MVAIEVPEVNYTEYSNRQLVAIPLAVLVLALAIIGGWYLVTGAPANLGLEFTGGVELRIADDGGDVEQQIETAFERQPDSVRSIPADDVYVVTFRAADEDPGGLADDLSAQADERGCPRARSIKCPPASRPTRPEPRCSALRSPSSE